MKMYKHLLLAIDVYENDDALVEEATLLVKRHQGILSLVHVAPHVLSSVPYAYDFQASIIEHARKKLAELKKKFKFNDKQIHLLEGQAKVEVTGLAKKIGADLIVCGSHGKHGFGLILGSTANGILHFADMDVLTIRINPEGKRLVRFPYKDVVVATNLHDDNLKVLDTANEIARAFGATLHVIHVVGDVAALGYYPAIEFDLKGDAEKELAKLVDQQKIEVKKENIHVSIGFPKQEILDLTARVQAGLIVIGSHGRKGLAAAVLGSTANAVLHGAQSDALVVRL